MSKEAIVRLLMVSPAVFGAFGFLVGFANSSVYASGLMYLGICFGAFVGTCAAVSCLMTNKFKCSHVAALCINAGIFFVVAKELMIIG